MQSVLSADYWHNLTLGRHLVPYLQQKLLEQFGPLLMPLLVDTPWHRPVGELADLIRRYDGSLARGMQLDDTSEQLVQLLESHLPSSGNDPLDLRVDHRAAAMTFAWSARARGDRAGAVAQLEIGVPATVTALLRARGIPEPVVSQFAHLAGTVDSVVLYHGLQSVAGRPEAPGWLIEAVIGWARTGHIPPMGITATIDDLLLAEGDRPFTPAQADIVAALLGDGLPAADIAGAARSLA